MAAVAGRPVLEVSTTGQGLVAGAQLSGEDYASPLDWTGWIMSEATE